MLLFKIKIENDKVNFQVNDFIKLFLEGGLFESYLDEIFGMVTHNSNLKIYNITFKETTPKSLLEDLFVPKEPQEIPSKDNIDFTIQVNRPLGYRQLVTLYPTPFDINKKHLKTITKNWGIIKHFEFGKHKKCPMIHNPYLHIYMENFNRKEAPDQLIFRNQFVAINTDGEPPKPRCNYCKKTDHLTEKISQIKSQIKSRLSPLTSIDNPSPLAFVTENFQSKSLLTSDLNTSPSSSTKQNVSNNFYLSIYLSSKTYETQQLLFLTLLSILIRFLPLI